MSCGIKELYNFMNKLNEREELERTKRHDREFIQQQGQRIREGNNIAND